MKKKDLSRVSRRRVMIMAASGFSGVIKTKAPSVKSNRIIEENKKQGSRDWQLTRVRFDKSQHRSSLIEGYCSKQSVAAGEKLDIMVSTNPAVPYKLDIYRTGYYGGTGARLVHSTGPLIGKTQPVPPMGERFLHECTWEPSVSLNIPDDWLSGVYIGKLRTLPAKADLPYWESYIIFIVRDERPVDLLFQCSDNTWQAYNRWPEDHSLYTDPRGASGPWRSVSFDRPYGRQSQFMSVVNDPLSFGSGEYISLEQPFSYFLEREGYDVAYCSNVDMITPDRGLKAKAFLSVGHDEYWDIRQFRSVEQLRDKGVNLLFFSGNSVCWVTPFSNSKAGVPGRVIHRDRPYAGNKQAAANILKSYPYEGTGPDEGMLMGVRNINPVNGGGDWTVTNPGHWIFKGTGMKKGDSIPGLVGWEYHGDPPNIPGLEIVAGGNVWQGGDVLQKWQAVIFPGPKKNFVFNASTIFWAQGLSKPPGHMLPWSHYSRPHGPDERVQQITRNLLNKAIS